MHPVLIDSWYGIAIHSYGTLILAGVLASMPGVWWDIGDRGWAGTRRTAYFLDLYLILFVGTVVGGRLMYVLTTPERLLAAPGRALLSDSTGFVFFGSFLGIVVGLVWLARRARRPVGELLDLVVTWLPLTHALGRVGCFLAGCCYGAPWRGPWSVRFPATSVAFHDAALPHVGASTTGLFPTQLVEAAGLMLLWSWLLASRKRRGPETPWRQTSRYALGYGLLRLAIESVRGDADRRFFFEWTWPAAAREFGLPADHVFALSTSQGGALLLIIAAAVVARRLRANSLPSTS